MLVMSVLMPVLLAAAGARSDHFGIAGPGQVFTIRLSSPGDRGYLVPPVSSSPGEVV
jgi:hypothetical protein